LGIAFTNTDGQWEKKNCQDGLLDFATFRGILSQKDRRNNNNDNRKWQYAHRCESLYLLLLALVPIFV
jgi:hypothetical protein